MDEQIQLSEFKFVNATNQNIYSTISLSSNKEKIMEYDINSVLDITQVYETERQFVDTFRFYGEVEYFSPLNAMITGYTELIDFFTVFSASTITKSVLTDFKFYLLAPTTGFTALVTGSTGGTLQKDYEVISEIDNFEIFRAGYSVNVYGEQQYAWDFNKSYNVKGRYDGLNFPLTDLYLYAEYQPQLNGDGDPESMSGKTYDSTGGTIIVNITSGVTGTTLTTGDTVTGDVIEWNRFLFTQETINRQEYYISTPYSGNTERLIWKYSPIIPLQIRVFEDDLQRANISGTSYEDVTSIPYYATQLDDGNFVWRNLQDKGFVDPLTNIGVSYPFVNKIHYVFNNIILAVKPDLNDSHTDQVFNEISFDPDTFISSQPNSDLNNIGKLCNF
jgi:hypothetical protein